jgi:hypothetical protein
VKLLGGDLAQRRELIDAGIVHQHVELAAKGLVRLCEQALHIGRVPDVRLHGDGPAARGFDGIDDPLRPGCIRGIVDDYAAPAPANCRAISAPTPFA